jgi:gliding-associated putative ABC transporter substrate-binding component GldG
MKAKFNKILKNKASLGMNALILAGILIVLNFFAYQIFYALDLTQNKDFSISKTTKDTLKNLDDIVNIKAYFSASLPSQYINLPQEVSDILSGYQTYSGGKVKYEFIDPKDNQDLQSELQIKGIPQLQFNVLAKDKYEVVNGYLGLAIQYGDKTEVIPVVQDTSNLEYLLTSKIKKLTTKDAPVIAFLSSNGSLSTETDIKEAYKSVSALYDVRQIDLSTDKEIPAEVKTLIIAGPKQAFKKEELQAIDKFVMRGGSLLLLLDGVTVGNSLQASVNKTGLDPLLAAYGLRLNQNLVLDSSAGIASFNQGFMTFNINYPFWPKVIKEDFDQNSTAVAKLESVVLPWASSIDVLQDKLPEGVTVIHLAKSTKEAWTQSEPFNLNPQQEMPKNKASQYDLAVSVAGKLKSTFGSDTTDNSRVILVGDSDFLRDSLASGNDNLIFFQNLVDSLSLDEGLINIRAKGIASRPLNELSDSSKASIRYLNVFGLTVLSLVFGLWRYYSRRRSRLADEF